MRKHVISGLLALLFLLALPLSAAAHAVPDESRNGHCSITVSMSRCSILVYGIFAYVSRYSGRR